MKLGFDAFFGTAAGIGGSISLLSLMLLPVILDRSAFRNWMGSVTAFWFFDIALQCTCTAAFPAALSLMILAGADPSTFNDLLRADVNLGQLSMLFGLISGLALSLSPYFIHRMMPFVRVLPLMATFTLIELGQYILTSPPQPDKVRLFIAFSLYDSFGLIFYSALFALGLKSESAKHGWLDLTVRLIDLRVALFSRYRISLPFLGNRLQPLVEEADRVADENWKGFVEDLFDLFKEQYVALRKAASNYARASAIVAFLAFVVAGLLYAYRPSEGLFGAPSRLLILALLPFAILFYSYVRRLLAARQMLAWLDA